MADSVKVNIISGFDAKGIQQAKAGIAQVGQASAAAASGVDGLGQASGQTLGKLKGAASSAAALSAALGASGGGVAAGARAASAGMQGFATGGWWGLILALLVAAAAAWISWKEKVKTALAESTKAFREHLTELQKNRLDTLVARYNELARSIKDAASAAAALNAASARGESAQTRLTVGRLQAERDTALSSTSDPAARKAIELRYAAQIAAVETQAAKVAAQYAQNAAAARLEAARAEQAAAQNQVKNLTRELTQTTLKDDVSKKLSAARLDALRASQAAAAAELDLQAADTEVTIARENILRSETEHAQKLSALTQAASDRLAASVELASAEAAAATLQQNLNAAIKDETKARSDAARAAARSESAGKGLLKDYVAGQVDKYKRQQSDMAEEEKFKDRVERLRQRRDSGRRLSERDRLTLDFADQRARAIEANDARAKRMGGAADAAARQQQLLTDQLSELRDIKTRLDAAIKVN